MEPTEKRTPEIEYKSLADAKRSLVHVKLPIYVIGPSGVGKNWMATQLHADHPKWKVVDMDKYGLLEPGTARWTIDINSLPKGDLYVGWGIGVRDFVAAHGGTVIVPKPSFPLWHAIQKAKLKDGTKERLNTGLLDMWKKTSEYSESQYHKFWNSKFEMIKSETPNSVFILVINTDADPKTITRGWFS